MSDSSETTRRRNLALLRSRHPSLAARYAGAPEFPEEMSLHSARSGQLVPTVRRQERLRWLHSRVDPDREAARLLALLPETSGFVVVFGLGGGHHIRRLLARPATRRVFVVETAPEWLLLALDIPEMAEVIADPRVQFDLSGAQAELTDRIAESYLPLFHRDAAFMPLRGRVDLELDAFRRLEEAAGQGIDASLADFATQRAFGRRWMHNICINLLRMSGRRVEEPEYSPGREAVITAAGPSMETLFEAKDPVGGRRALADGAPLVATDTSLPMLLQRDTVPDLLVSLDSQGASYHHLLRGIPAETLLVAPLSAAPVVLRTASRICPTLGGHPLEHYLAEEWYTLPDMYTSGGSVTHAAVSLARRQLGKTEIFLYGADFAYPDAAAYARDSYMHRHFRLREQRLQPAEGGFADFVYRRARLDEDSAGTTGGAGEPELRYCSALLEGYRRRFEALTGRLDVSLQRAPPEAPRGGADTAPPGRPPVRPGPGVDSRGGTGLPDPRGVLSRYLGRLDALADPDTEASTLDPGQLPPGEQRLWFTLTPLAASLSTTSDGKATPAEAPGHLLIRARRQAQKLLRSILAS